MKASELRFRPVKLEFLRPGPRHNQLLSPLTPYVGLCGDQAPAPVTLRWEHRHWLRAMRGLRYVDPTDSPEMARDRREHLRDAQVEVTHLLEQVPAFLSETAGDAAVQVRLVITPMELAMLPFEAALAPRGMAGEGRPLLADGERKVVITREIRSGTTGRVELPSEARVLLVVAQPEGWPAVPFRAHLAALAQALAPWEGPAKPTPARGATLQVAMLDYQGQPLLSVLQHTTLESLSAALKGQDYTHVHVLAHGAPIEPLREQFGLVLHARRGGAHVVDADTLAPEFRSRIGSCGPTYVTLATCDSGAAHDVQFGAVSLAHAIHAQGVPIVIGSQYPLTMQGSVRFARAFYTPLFAGWNPLWALHEGRKALHQRSDHDHDWASLVAYTRLPWDLADQMAHVWFERINKRLWTASKWMDTGRPREAVEALARTREALRKLDTWAEENVEWLQADPRRIVQLEGRRGGALRRQASLEGGRNGHSRSLLEQARAAFGRAVAVVPQDPWTTGQFLSLSAALGYPADDEDLLALWRLMWANRRAWPADAAPEAAWSAADRVDLVLQGQYFEVGPTRDHLEAVLDRALNTLKADTLRGGFVARVVARHTARYVEQLKSRKDAPSQRLLAGAKRVINQVEAMIAAGHE